MLVLLHMGGLHVIQQELITEELAKKNDLVKVFLLRATRLERYNIASVCLKQVLYRWGNCLRNVGLFNLRPSLNCCDEVRT
ncbi:hypothetical protein BZY94_30910 [Burkholderia territorii]|nr:hypothetical protein BZY94_30910 [Burkholderia territorii]